MNIVSIFNSEVEAKDLYFEGYNAKSIINRIMTDLYGSFDVKKIVADGLYYAVDDMRVDKKKIEDLDMMIFSSVVGIATLNTYRNPVLRKPSDNIHPLFADKDDTDNFNKNNVVFMARVACSDKKLDMDCLDDYSNQVEYSDYFIKTHQDIFKNWLKNDTGIQYDGQENIKVNHLITVSDNMDVNYYRQYTFFDTESQIETTLMVKLDAKDLPTYRYYALSDFQME